MKDTSKASSNSSSIPLQTNMSLTSTLHDSASHLHICNYAASAPNGFCIVIEGLRQSKEDALPLYEHLNYQLNMALSQGEEEANHVWSNFERALKDQSQQNGTLITAPDLAVFKAVTFKNNILSLAAAIKGNCFGVVVLMPKERKMTYQYIESKNDNIQNFKNNSLSYYELKYDLNTYPRIEIFVLSGSIRKYLSKEQLEGILRKTENPVHLLNAIKSEIKQSQRISDLLQQNYHDLGMAYMRLSPNTSLL